MGPEFATVVTAIDNRGYSVCKVSSLGKLTKDLFVDLFENHLRQHRTNGKIHRIAVVAERTLWITSELLFAKAH